MCREHWYDNIDNDLTTDEYQEDILADIARDSNYGTGVAIDHTNSNKFDASEDSHTDYSTYSRSKERFLKSQDLVTLLIKSPVYTHNINYYSF